MDNRTRWLLEAPLNGVLLKLTAPSTFAFAVQAAVTLAEVWFIGQLGTSALAAMALVFPLLMLMQTMSGGALGGAISASIARSLGAGQSDKAEQLIWHALLFALMGALIFLILFALGGRELLVLLGGEAQLLELAADYCWILFLGGASVWLSSGLSAVFRGMGLMGFSAMIMILGARDSDSVVWRLNFRLVWPTPARVDGCRGLDHLRCQCDVDAIFTSLAG